MNNKLNDKAERYWDLDDHYNVQPHKVGKPINNRMATLKRINDQLNRYRNAGVLK